MHPLFARPSRFLAYLAAWLVAGFLLAAALAVITPRPFGQSILFAVPLSVFYGGVCLAAWWVCRSRPLAPDAVVPAVLAQLGASFLSTIIWVIAATAWATIIAKVSGSVPDRVTMSRDATVLMGIGVPAYLLSAGAHYLYIAIEDAHAAARQALEYQVSAREAELRAVRAQLNPHFLFNSLHSISSLVGSDPEGARRMCERLGDFMRRTLQLGSREAVSLGDELALVERYLGIEAVRFGARLATEIDVPAEAREALVPPLLLQPLVENAIKHGVADRIEGGLVRLSARRDGDRLTVVLENPLDPEAPPRRGEGMGLEIVRRRLDAVGDARIRAGQADGMYRVTLDLPLVVPAGAREVARA